MKNPHKIEISEVIIAPDIGFGLTEVADLLRSKKNVLTRLKGDGDFRSQECIELMRQSSVVVTNPPFSLFREFVAQLDGLGKEFIIVGNKNAITYKEVFKLIKENKMWIGNTPMGTDMLFDIPESFAKELIASKKQGSAYKIVDGVIKGRSQAIWFTNLDVKKRHKMLYLYKRYTPQEYPKYDNYEAIEISKTTDIPENYDGIMGVPISFLDKYNPAQFEILGMSASAGYNAEVVGVAFLGNKDARPLINGKNTYARVFIKHRKT